MDESTKGTLMVVSAAACFGTVGIWGELAASIDLALSTLLPFRFALAALLVAALSVAGGGSPAWCRRTGAVAVGLGAAYAALTLAFFLSLRHLTAGLATILLYTYPAFVFVLSAAFLRESVGVRKALAFVLALSGVALVVRTDAAGADLIGVALALVAALSYAVYTTGSRPVLARVPPRTLLLGTLTGSTVCMVGYGLLAGGIALPAGRSEWGIVLGLTVVGTVAPLLLFYGGLSRLEAGRVGVVSTFEPVVTVVLGAVLLGEPVTIAVVAGGALVLGGVLLVQGGQSDGIEPDGRPTADG